MYCEKCKQTLTSIACKEALIELGCSANASCIDDEDHQWVKLGTKDAKEQAGRNRKG